MFLPIKIIIQKGVNIVFLETKAFENFIAMNITPILETLHHKSL